MDRATGATGTNPTNGANGVGESRALSRILLVSVPRTASNLLLKVLNIQSQPSVLTNELGGYYFQKPFMLAARDIKKPPHLWTDAERAQVRDAYQTALGVIEESSAQARREGKRLFAKEHAFWMINPDAGLPVGVGGGGGGGSEGKEPDFFRLRVPDDYGTTRTFSRNNHTVLPDEYLATWQLAFVIRHPALAWPSLYRAMHKQAQRQIMDEEAANLGSLHNMTLAWTRRLYDWCVERPGGRAATTAPPVIDAHDLIHNPAAVLRFCEALGLDTSLLQFEWAPETDRKLPGSEAERESARIMLSTLAESQGLRKDKAPAVVDMKAEAEKWKAEFGDEVAAMIEKAVRDSMPDYEYLKARSVQA